MKTILTIQLALGEAGFYRSFPVKDPEKAAEILDDITVIVAKRLREIEKAPTNTEEPTS